MTDPVRLAKRVAELLACSRREAEQIIAGGWGRVDGVVIEEPQFSGAPISASKSTRWPTPRKPRPSPCC